MDKKEMTTSYKPNILILGQSGTGKSTSLRNIPRDATTHFIDLERKALPFKGSFAVHKYIDEFGQIESNLRASLADTTCQRIVFESFIKYCEMSVAYCRCAYKGWDIWANHSTNIALILNLLKSKTKVIIVTSIDEVVSAISESGGTVSTRRASVSAGKEWEGKVEKEFLLTLFTSPTRDATSGKVNYRFLTNSDGVCNAKSPMGMLPPTMDNDIGTVLTKIEEYYK